MKRRVLGVAVAACVLGVSTGSVGAATSLTLPVGAATSLTRAGVPEAGIVVSYPAQWIRVPLGAPNTETALEAMQAQDPQANRARLTGWLDLSAARQPNFFAVDGRSGDLVLVIVRHDDFDEAFSGTSMKQLKRELKAEAQREGARLVSVHRTMVGSRAAYRWLSKLDDVGIRTETLAFAHSVTNATITVSVSTDDDYPGRQVAAMILDSVQLA